MKKNTSETTPAQQVSVADTAASLPDINALESLAESGNTDAMHELGHYYAAEDTFNYLEATKWLRMAAKAGHDAAMCTLGAFLIDQYKDYKEAIQWFHLAVDEHNNMQAMLALGHLYNTESFEYKEVEKSEIWFKKAVKQGSVEAMHALGMLFSEQDPIRKGRDAVLWFKKAAEKGHAPSMYGLGMVYGKNQSPMRDLQKSCQWFLQAANAGFYDALVPLGLLFMLENGITTNYIVAYALFHLSSTDHDDAYTKTQAYQQAEILKQHMQEKEITEAIDLAKAMSVAGKLIASLKPYVAN